MKLEDLKPEYQEQARKQLKRRTPLQRKTPLKRNKYHAETAESSDVFPEMRGWVFDSKLERRCGEELMLRQRAGEISHLKHHPGSALILETPLGAIKCKIDFWYIEDGEEVHEEAKGMNTDRWSIIRRLWSLCGPTRLVVYYGNGRRETIIPRGLE